MYSYPSKSEIDFNFRLDPLLNVLQEPFLFPQTEDEWLRSCIQDFPKQVKQLERKCIQEAKQKKRLAEDGDKLHHQLVLCGEKQAQLRLKSDYLSQKILLVQSEIKDVKKRVAILEMEKQSYKERFRFL